MALCGFNQQMLIGEKQFAVGLWEQLIKRSQQENLSFSETLQLEINEMDEFEKHLRASGDVEQVEDVLGIVYFARSLYRQALKGGATAEAYTANMEKSIERHFQMDSFYYSTLRPQFGPFIGLQKLAEFLQQNPLS